MKPTTTTTNGGAPETPAAATPQPGPGDRLLLWQLARNGMPEASVLKALGLAQAELEAFVREHAETYAEYKRNALSVQLLSRKAMGELVLIQFLNHLLAAETPAQAASVLRVCGQLPEWVLPGQAAAELNKLNGAQLTAGAQRLLLALDQPESRQVRRANQRKAAKRG